LRRRCGPILSIYSAMNSREGQNMFILTAGVRSMLGWDATASAVGITLTTFIGTTEAPPNVTTDWPGFETGFTVGLPGMALTYIYAEERRLIYRTCKCPEKYNRGRKKGQENSFCCSITPEGLHTLAPRPPKTFSRASMITTTPTTTKTIISIRKTELGRLPMGVR